MFIAWYLATIIVLKQPPLKVDVSLKFTKDMFTEHGFAFAAVFFSWMRWNYRVLFNKNVNVYLHILSSCKKGIKFRGYAFFFSHLLETSVWGNGIAYWINNKANNWSVNK